MSGLAIQESSLRQEPFPEVTNLNSLPLKPWQRLAASMFATGTPISDISAHVIQPAEVISDFITSPSGQVIVGQILTENKDRLDDLLDAAAVDSLLTLIRIRDTSKNESSRIAACKELLAKTLPGVKAREERKKETDRHGLSLEDEISRLQDSVKTI